MNTLILVLTTVAINWQLQRGVSMISLIVVAALIVSWRFSLFMIEKWEEEKRDHEEMMRGVDFPKTLSVEVIRKDAEGDPNRMIWSLNPGSAFEDLPMKLQKYLDLKLNPRLDISVKVYPRPHGVVWVNFRKKKGDEWEEIFLEGEEALKFFFNQQRIEFLKPKVIDKAGQITSG